MCGLAFDCCIRQVINSFLHACQRHHVTILRLSVDRALVRGWRVLEVCSWYCHVGHLFRPDSLHLARGLLKSLSIKQGIKYDSPESACEIPAFIEFHKLNVNEILDPLPSFGTSISNPHPALCDPLLETFNQFFYRLGPVPCLFFACPHWDCFLARKLKPAARPVETPDDPNRLVSGGDCRLMAFETTSEATKLWIKGREFTVARLLGDAYKGQAERYVGGALVIFRLAPQDYHRFHSPVDGTIGPMTYISGEYYTVNVSINVLFGYSYVVCSCAIRVWV